MRWLRIDRTAIEHNVAAVVAAVAPSRVLVVVKADGYGHGAVISARAALAGGAHWLGTADVDEARELRAAGIDAPVLAWLHDAAGDFGPALADGIELGVSSRGELSRVLAAAESLPGVVPVVHLKADTGLGRNGAPASEWGDLVAAAAAAERSGALRVRGLWTHLANTSVASNEAQAAEFAAATARARAAGLTPEVEHLEASEAIVGGRLDHLAPASLVRLGIAAYGLAPADGVDGTALGLRPAMELSASVVSVKPVPADHGVSYGHLYRTSAPTRLALIPLGYADGVPRAATGRGEVWIKGQRYPVVGRIAMDQIVADVGDDEVAPGDRAVIFGDPEHGYPSADEWAEAAGTIGYEIVTRIGRRPRREVS